VIRHQAIQLLAGVALLSGCALASGAAAQSGVVRSVSVSGEGRASSPPDEASVEIGVETRNGDAARALDENGKKMAGVIAALDRIGIAAKDRQTTRVGLDAQREYDGGRPGPLFFLARNSLRVRVRDLAVLGRVLASAVEAGANEIQGVSFAVADPKALESRARAEAMADARARAEALAQAAGASLGLALQVSEGVSRPLPPLPVLKAESFGRAAAEPVPISAGEHEVVVRVEVTFGLR
jgi:hypothetical protein